MFYGSLLLIAVSGYELYYDCKISTKNCLSTAKTYVIFVLNQRCYTKYSEGEECRLEIKKPAIAGTLESSDCMVTVEPGEGRIDLDLDSAVIRQYGKQIRKVILETLERLEVSDARITVVDKGALDCTIKARVECAVYRANGQKDNLPWGGAIV